MGREVVLKNKPAQNNSTWKIFILVSNTPHFLDNFEDFQIHLIKVSLENIQNPKYTKICPCKIFQISRSLSVQKICLHKIL